MGIDGRKIDDVEFFHIHEPLISRSGRQITKGSVRTSLNFVGRVGSLDSFFDGMVIGEDDNEHSSLFSNYAKTPIHTYAYLAIPSKNPQCGFEFCWLKVLEFDNKQSPSIQGSFIEGDFKSVARSRGSLFNLSVLKDVSVSGNVDVLNHAASDAEWPDGFCVSGLVRAPLPKRLVFTSKTPFLELNSEFTNRRVYMSGVCYDVDIQDLSQGLELRISDFRVGALSFNSKSAGAEVFIQNSQIERGILLVNAKLDRFRMDDCILGRSSDYSIVCEGAISSSYLKSVSFTNNTFRNTAIFRKVVIDEIHIRRCIFESVLDLSESRLSKTVVLSDGLSPSIYRAGIDLFLRQSASTEDRSIGNFKLENASVKREVDFTNRIMDDRASFDGTYFSEVPRFFGCELAQDTSFRNVTIDWASIAPKGGTGKALKLLTSLKPSQQKKALRRSVRAFLKRSSWGKSEAVD